MTETLSVKGKRNFRIAHLSDLHIGLNARVDAAAERLSEFLSSLELDHVLVTGDITHRGRRTEFHRFQRIFLAHMSSERLIAVPGNHDRLGDDLEKLLMFGERVQVFETSNLFLVKLNSTGEHNRNWIFGQGLLTPSDVEEVKAAFASAPPDKLSVLMMHHHPLPLPEDGFSERLQTWVGLSSALELELGQAMLDGLKGKCDVILHGHRHLPSEHVFQHPSGRSMIVFNAGSTTHLQGFRLIESNGSKLASTQWLRVSETPATLKPAHRGFALQ